ncbi:MAG: BON domain-containing protein [Gaiellaceae bacterium]
MARFQRPLALGSLLGSAAAYLFDPENGKRRRRMVVDRTRGSLRRAGRRLGRAGRGVRADVYGASQKARHLHEQPKDYDDVTLARKVETELFRPPDVPKGKINVNVVGGVVELRGAVDSPQLIEELIGRARGIQGVRDVESHIHVS